MNKVLILTSKWIVWAIAYTSCFKWSLLVDVYVWIIVVAIFFSCRCWRWSFPREITCKCMLNVGSMQCYVEIAIKNGVIIEWNSAKNLWLKFWVDCFLLKRKKKTIAKLQDHCQKLLGFTADIEDGNRTHRTPHKWLKHPPQYETQTNILGGNWEWETVDCYSLWRLHQNQTHSNITYTHFPHHYVLAKESPNQCHERAIRYLHPFIKNHTLTQTNWTSQIQIHLHE